MGQLQTPRSFGSFQGDMVAALDAPASKRNNTTQPRCAITGSCYAENSSEAIIIFLLFDLVTTPRRLERILTTANPSVRSCSTRLYSQELTIMSAVRRVFQTPELFEAIFEFLYDIVYDEETDHDFEDAGDALTLSEPRHLLGYHPTIAYAAIMGFRQVCKHWNDTITSSGPLQRALGRQLNPTLPQRPPKFKHAHKLFDWLFDFISEEERGPWQIHMFVRRADIDVLATRARREPLCSVLAADPPVTIVDTCVWLYRYRWNGTHHEEPRTGNALPGYDADGECVYEGSRLATTAREGGFTIGGLILEAENAFKQYPDVPSVIVKSMDHIKNKRLAVLAASPDDVGKGF
ncbi:hypothetical protein SCAR479_08424 [Seiridium cardinale]|uniref:Uncharacterized protein n=1 Tax=Seiridium cardinale TaxID=138064 RepID=A0ABR2XM64_9PEZI